MYQCHEMAVVIRVTYGQAGSLVGSDISGSLKDQDPHASVRLKGRGSSAAESPSALPRCSR
jgi:hypothetical protein